MFSCVNYRKNVLKEIKISSLGMLILLNFILQHTHLIPQPEYSSFLSLMSVIQNVNFVILMFQSEKFITFNLQD
jgi:hypothetical protein